MGILIATAAAAGEAAADNPMGATQYLELIVQFLPIVLLVVMFWFFLIRPQRKRDKEERNMRDSIQVGDEISTIGGFIGKVVNIKDDVFIIETSNDRTKLKIYRWAIRGKEAPATDGVEAPKEADDSKKK